MGVAQGRQVRESAASVALCLWRAPWAGGRSRRQISVVARRAVQDRSLTTDLTSLADCLEAMGRRSRRIVRVRTADHALGGTLRAYGRSISSLRGSVLREVARPGLRTV